LTDEGEIGGPAPSDPPEWRPANPGEPNPADVRRTDPSPGQPPFRADPSEANPGGVNPTAANPGGANPTAANAPEANPGGANPSEPPHLESSRPAEEAGAGSLFARSAAHRRRKHDEKRGKPHRKAPWWELPALVVLAIGIAILVKSFIIQPFYIPSESMEKTLHGCSGCHGDRILVNKLIYDFRDPHPGDIVVFHAPPGWNDEPTSQPPSNPVLRVIRGFGQLIGFVPPDGQVLVKRVIATGGETVKGDSEGHVMVSEHGANGPYRTLHEPYVFIDRGQQDSLRPFGPVTVPNGRLWVMGDHRNDSADSRYHCGSGGTDVPDDSHCDAVPSTVPIDDVIGKAFVIAWPPSRWRTLGTPPTFESAARISASGVSALVSVATVLPIFGLRRRHRRRRP
jgi:signal peptidase I